GDGEGEVVFGHAVLDSINIFFVVELGRVYTNDQEVLLVLVPVLPVPVMRIVVDAVDAAVGPEVHDYHLSLLVRELEGSRVDPVRHPGELGGRCRVGLDRGWQVRFGPLLESTTRDDSQHEAQPKYDNCGAFGVHRRSPNALESTFCCR